MNEQVYSTASRTKSQTFFRWFFYLLGLSILSLGIILNTKSNFGVTPIISVPYVISIIGNLNFGDISLIAYVVIAIIEYIIKWDKFKLYDLLQIPLAIAMTRLFNVFGAVLPEATTLTQQIICLALGISLTGIGAAMNLNERLVPNPGDGIVQAISDRSKKSVGFCKNCLDLVCVCICVAISFVATGTLTGVGIGTVAAVIGVGRFMALYNHFFAAPTIRISGMAVAEA